MTLDASRTDRKMIRKTRRDLGRGRALYAVAHPELNWFDLALAEKKKWVKAFHRAQEAAELSPPGSHILVAIAIGKTLGVVKDIMSVPRGAPEEHFILLETATQQWLWLTALRAQWILKSNTTTPITTTIEIHGAAGPEIAEAVFEAAQEAGAALEDEHPGRRWDTTISQTR